MIQRHTLSNNDSTTDIKKKKEGKQRAEGVTGRLCNVIGSGLIEQVERQEERQ